MLHPFEGFLGVTFRSHPSVQFEFKDLSHAPVRLSQTAQYASKS